MFQKNGYVLYCIDIPTGVHVRGGLILLCNSQTHACRHVANCKYRPSAHINFSVFFLSEVSENKDIRKGMHKL